MCTNCHPTVRSPFFRYLDLFIYIHYFESVNTFCYTAILPCGPLVTKYKYIHVKDIKQIHTGQLHISRFNPFLWLL